MSADRAEPTPLAADTLLLHEGAALVTTNPFEEGFVDAQKRLLGSVCAGAERVIAMMSDGDAAPSDPLRDHPPTHGSLARGGGAFFTARRLPIHDDRRRAILGQGGMGPKPVPKVEAPKPTPAPAAPKAEPAKQDILDGKD